jgi:small subunit ribosomal protein S4
MAKVTKPVCRHCIRYAEKLYLKGSRCESDKCPLDPRKNKKISAMAKTSEYGMQLREKNKAKIYYGVLERQFQKYFELAKKAKGVTGEILLQTLERRLDNIIYRLKWVESRRMAKQVIVHGFIFVNGKKVDKPSFVVDIGDEINIKKDSSLEKYIIKHIEEKKGQIIPVWIENFGPNEIKSKIARFPTRTEIPLSINEQLIINFYSK